jgi:hypothetical protein
MRSFITCALLQRNNLNDKGKKAEMGRARSTYESKENTCRILMGKEKERTTRKIKNQTKPRRKWLNNIKLALRKIEWDVMD